MPKLIIASHHKTGTVLMGRLFNILAARLGLKLVDCSHPQEPGEPKIGDLTGRDEADILVDCHSTFQCIPAPILQDALGVHMIRDPRIVAVSSAFYHQRSREGWLRVPLKRFGGMSYQQKICSLKTDRDRFLFEMDERSGRVIRRMQAIMARDEAWRRDVKLEDLMLDEGLDHFMALGRHMRLAGRPLVVFLGLAHGLSVFNPEMTRAEHIRARKPEFWGDYYDDDLAGSFEQRFPGAVEALGYCWGARDDVASSTAPLELSPCPD